MDVEVFCPLCGEPLALRVDPTGGRVQRYVEDCAVCCQPMDVTVRVRGDEVDVQVEPSGGD